MMSALNIASMGLGAADLRMQASASNIANLQSAGSTGPSGPKPYAPVRVDQSSLPGGGVEAKTSSITPASVRQYQPDSQLADAKGFVAMPNVDMIAEVTNMVSAKNGFSASLQVMQVSSDMIKKLYELD
jgi:flagellar basal-body rod protein FlgC